MQPLRIALAIAPLGAAVGVVHLASAATAVRAPQAPITPRQPFASPAALVAETEPNDSAPDATSVGLGDTVVATFHSAGDVDWFRVPIPAAGVYYVEQRPTPTAGSSYPWFRWYDTDGVTRLDDMIDLGFKVGYFPAPGNYFLQTFRHYSSQFGDEHPYQFFFGPAGPGDPWTQHAGAAEKVAFGGDGTLYVANRYDVHCIAPSGDTVGTISLQQRIQDVAVDAYGTLLVLHPYGLLRYVDCGAGPQALTDFAGHTLATDASGDIWIGRTYWTGGSLRRYDRFGAPLEEHVFGREVQPSSLAFSPTGELFFAGGSGVFHFVAGEAVPFLQYSDSFPGRGASHLAFDVNGGLYVALAVGTSGKLVLYAADGTVLQDPFALGTTEVPSDLAFGRDPDGGTNARLFAAHGVAWEVNPTGVPAPGWPVQANLLAILPDTLPPGFVGREYDDTLAAIGGRATRTWSVVQGALPPGLTLEASTGRIAGVPSDTGTFAFRIRAASDTLSDERDFSILVAEQVSITTTALEDGTVGARYEAALSATGGAGAYLWQVVAGELPHGLTLQGRTGVIGGVPTESGAFQWTVRCRGAVVGSAERELTMTVTEPEVALDAVVDELLGMRYALSDVQRRYLDMMGHRNDRLDVADLRAYLMAAGALGGSAAEAQDDSTAGAPGGNAAAAFGDAGATAPVSPVEQQR